MLWCNKQNLDKPIVGPDGVTWCFLVGWDFVEGVHVQRIFFWNAEKSVTGMAEWRGDNTMRIRRIRDRIHRIARDEAYRSRFVRPIDFPVERYW